MFIIDALVQIFAFFQSLLFEGFVSQSNDEALIYNVGLVILRLIGLAEGFE